jgi:hypothetical protein
MSEESLNRRVRIRAAAAELERALEGTALDVWELEIVSSNLALIRLSTELEAFIEKDMAGLTVQMRALLERSESGEPVTAEECSRLAREAEKCVRLQEDTAKNVAATKWPTRILEMLPRVAQSGAALEKPLSVLPLELLGGEGAATT